MKKIIVILLLLSIIPLSSCAYPNDQPEDQAWQQARFEIRLVTDVWDDDANAMVIGWFVNAYVIDKGDWVVFLQGWADDHKRERPFTANAHRIPKSQIAFIKARN